MLGSALLPVAVLSWLGGSPAPSQLCRPSAWGKPHLFRPTAVRMEQATASKQIQVGATLPEVEVDVASAESVDPAFERIGTVLGPGRSILLGMPGAFTPACTDVHLPGFLRAADTFADCAIDKIVVCTANDRWTNDAWANAVTANACGMLPVASESGSNVEYVADARGDLLSSSAGARTHDHSCAPLLTSPAPNTHDHSCAPLLTSPDPNTHDHTCACAPLLTLDSTH